MIDTVHLIDLCSGCIRLYHGTGATSPNRRCLYLLSVFENNVNKNPTRCNSKQIFIYCKVTLHVSGVTVPIIRSTKTVTAASGTGQTAKHKDQLERTNSVGLPTSDNNGRWHTNTPTKVQAYNIVEVRKLKTPWTTNMNSQKRNMDDAKDGAS